MSARNRIPVAKELEIPVQALEEIITNFYAEHGDGAKLQLVPLTTLMAKYSCGIDSFRATLISGFLAEYLKVEKPFSRGLPLEDAIMLIKEECGGDASAIYNCMLANKQRRNTCLLVKGLIEYTREKGLVGECVGYLQQICALEQKASSEVSNLARQVLFENAMPSFRERFEAAEIYLSSLCVSSAESQKRSLDALLDPNNSIVEVLVQFFRHPEPSIRAMALEVYIRREYSEFQIADFAIETSRGVPHATWSGTQPDGSKHVCLLAVFDSLDYFDSRFSGFLTEMSTSLPRDAAKPDTSLVVNVVLPHAVKMAEFIESFQATCFKASSVMRNLSVERVTSIVIREHGLFPEYHTFHEQLAYAEDPLMRHINPPQAFQLELSRLANFSIERCEESDIKSNTEIHASQMHVYYAAEISDGEPSNMLDKRLFARAVEHLRSDDEDSQQNPSEGTFNDCLSALEAVIQGQGGKTLWNHVFINVTHVIQMSQEAFLTVVQDLCKKNKNRLRENHVSEIEWKIRLQPDDTKWRFVASTTSGQHFTFETYKEVPAISETRDRAPSDGSCASSVYEKFLRMDEAAGAGWTFSSTSATPGPWHNQPVMHAYTVLDKLTRKRIHARRMGTTFVHDYVDLFAAACAAEWDALPSEVWPCARPSSFVESSELVLDMSSPSKVKEVTQSASISSIGMVAWKMTIRTPEYPEGRQIIVIANDMTHEAGSFGTKEDDLYAAASAMARSMKIPRVYLAANSGARIGLAEEVKSAFKVAWNDEEDPAKGFQYLYFDEETYNQLAATNSVKAERKEENGEVRYRLTDVIGAKEDLGVECLRGSGLIAGETSRAYNEIVTITYTTARTVGIGSYVLRLGQRSIMHENSSIILTGFNALNKLLGSDVYTSNAQLGGPRIMCNNGVTHLSSSDDASGVQAIVHWLRYVPSVVGGDLPLLPTSDPVNREIDYVPTRSPYDPRHLVAGHIGPDGTFQSGFFDKGSFTETLGSWAKTVVTGRGTLGGLPMGCVLVETRTQDQIVPADPASPETQEQVSKQAGQVWFPDSAYKTSQALEDFNREGLPVIIMANWRGFSGGQRDMYNEVLKYGSFIVDALVGYKQPVFVYIPPKGELRGGAWVVIDPQINSDVMEMFADIDSRGGVLEPEGIVEIKFRQRDLVKTMHRLDSKLMQLDAELRAEGLTDDMKRQLQAQIKDREERLLPFYKTVAVQFADMHDTPGRMLAKGVISNVVSWKSARGFFYWRLRRRLNEFKFLNNMQSLTSCPRSELKALLASWISHVQSDEEAVQALESEPVDLKVKEWTQQARLLQLTEALNACASNGVDMEAIVAAFSSWQSEQ